MNLFAEELRKICSKCEYISDPKFVGRAAIFKLSDGVTGKLEFMTQGIANQFNALRLSVISRNEGQIDCQLVNLTELLGRKKHIDCMVDPHIWVDAGKPKWFGFTPTERDYSAMAQTTDDYLSCFADQDISESEDEALDINLY